VNRDFLGRKALFDQFFSNKFRDGNKQSSLALEGFQAAEVNPVVEGRVAGVFLFDCGIGTSKVDY
jgi:hypothetical protein